MNHFVFSFSSRSCSTAFSVSLTCRDVRRVGSSVGNVPGISDSVSVGMVSFGVVVS